jgi:hypothetical protein
MGCVIFRNWTVGYNFLCNLFWYVLFVCGIANFALLVLNVFVFVAAILNGFLIFDIAVIF